MSKNTLLTLATELARKQNRTVQPTKRRFFIPETAEKTLDRYYSETENGDFDIVSGDSAGAWLVENYGFIKAELCKARKETRTLPRSIPSVADGIMRGVPRIFALASEYVEFTGGVVDEDELRDFLKQYQTVTSLTFDELWLLKIAFSLTILKYILTLAGRHYEAMSQKRRINKIIGKLLSSDDVKMQKITDFCNTNNAVSLAAFISAVENNSRSEEVLNRLDKELSMLNIKPNEVIEFAHRIESNCTVIIRNLITSLMKLGRFDWEGIFCEVSNTEKILTEDGVYRNMDVETKNQYRRKLVRYAKRHRLDEKTAAEKMLSEAKASGMHFGFEFFKRNGAKEVAKRAVYLTTLYLVTVAIYAGLLGIGRLFTASTTVYILMAILTIIPSKITADEIVNYAATRIIKPQKLPRMDYENGIPSDCKTVVVIPTLMSDEKTVAEVAERTEINYLANRSENLYFVLLGDYADSDCEQNIEDEKIRRFARETVKKLNEKYGRRLFFYIQRDRSFNTTQQRFFGWERKRGAVIQFNRLVVNGDKSGFSYLSKGIDEIIGARYVITLDADTVMPPQSTIKLVATANHPLNRPIFDEDSGKVVSGYGVLQPRMETGFESVEKTAFSRLMSGEVGSEPYSPLISEVFQDVFGSGNFGGKGIYQPEVFLKAIDGKFRENSILSHDMIEGCFLHSGFASDIKFIDEMPSAYASYRKRQHRWIRGDWQLLPFLRTKTDGNLDLTGKIKVLRNLLRPLFELSLCLLILVGVFSRTATAVFLTLFGLYYLFPTAVDVADRIKRKLNFLPRKRIDLSLLARPAFELIFLADTAANSLDAVVRTLFRLKSGRKLLEWQTAMQTESAKKDGVRYTFSLMRVSALFGLAVLVLSLITVNFVTTVLGLLLIIAPIIATVLSKETAKKSISLSADEEEIIHIAAMGAWRYFREFVSEENNFLPPDNYQEVPYRGVALRTSPTNIGMMLVGAVASEKLGYSDKKEVIEITNGTLKTLEKLQKQNGQPYNWYDIVSLKPLYPCFVSTADNGNLACSLVVLREALNEYSEELKNEAKSEKIIMTLNESLSIIKGVLKEMDFSHLYNKKKNLLSVGFNTVENRLSEYDYDLLASEARLASFYAIASGNVPSKHWERLARPLATANGRTFLKSWSGTMFEYLMPRLVLKEFRGSLMSKTFFAVIKEQIRCGRANPWGVSESGYMMFDEDGNYQYKAFGIPSLAVRHIDTKEHVIAPYASALALAVEPKAAAYNLMRLKNIGMCGRFGFYEALDLSGDGALEVKSYMAHHEGMTLVAAANCLEDDCIVKLFHKAKEVKAAEILLAEKMPTELPDASIILKKSAKNEKREAPLPIEEHFSDLTTHPHLTMLTNGFVTAIIGNTGSNMLFCGETLINKWKSDEIAENYGHFVFIKDTATKKTYSLTPSPMYGKAQSDVTFRSDSVTFQRHFNGFETCLKIAVSTEKNAIIYSAAVVNTSKKARTFEIADYLLPCLENERASLTHEQYSDMFVSCRFIEEKNTVIAERTPHTDGEKRAFCAVTVSGDVGEISPILSRYDFVGRGKTLMKPAFADNNFGRKNVKNSPMMPMLSLSGEVVLEKDESKTVNFVVSYSTDKAEIIKLADFFANAESIKPELELAYERAGIGLRYRQIDAKKFVMANNIISRLYYQQCFRRDVSFCRNETLWKYGISGDLPIIFIETNEIDVSGLRLMLELIGYVSMGGIGFDTVIVTHDDGYHRTNYLSAENAVRTSSVRELINRHIFIIDRATSGEDVRLIRSRAVLAVSGNEASIASKLIYDDTAVRRSLVLRLKSVAEKAPLDLPSLSFFNGYGGFDSDFTNYTICLKNGKTTPHPWCNVLANKSFGTLISERGTGYTWYKNSRENKLSRWSNDPICDVPSEVVFIRDEATFEVTSPAKIIDDNGDYSVTHGIGWSELRHNALGLEMTQTVYVPTDDSLKIINVDVQNNSDETRKIALFYYTDCLLSSNTKRTADDIRTWREKSSNTVFAENTTEDNGIMFVGCNRSMTNVWTNKLGFTGKTGSITDPEALKSVSLKHRDEKGISDCIAFKSTALIKAHFKQRFVIIVGAGESADLLKITANKYLRNDFFEKTKADIYSLTHPFRITTNDKKLDALFNSFLMYQVLFCRYYARTSFYQCSGAYGFRDQLQDAAAFVYADKDEARKHIVKAASEQYTQGDVRHWWHGDGNGIRTRISDDALFLPFAVTEYVRITGDKSILTEEVGYLKGRELKDGEKSLYGIAEKSGKTGTVYEHCMKAIRRVRFGTHLLALIGTGDWNDGFDKVGEEGKGESVWLSMFFVYVLKQFLPFASENNDGDELCGLIRKAKAGLDMNAWDGSWFKRAYFDDGTPIGSSESDECRIDVITQAWSAFAELDENKVKKALDSAYGLLVDGDLGLVKLFTPPFGESKHNPGYIMSYKKGIRENGGQYTHAAIWFAMALAITGDGKRAYDVIKMLNPLNHSATKDGADRYKVEPYVMAADVYTLEGEEGMGGWTWYTGSAAWMYKAILEVLLGIKKEGNTIKVTPSVPDELLPFRVEYNHREDGVETKYVIDVVSKGTRLELDGVLLESSVIPIISDGNKHRVIVGQS